jgi:hypothetical protein
LDEEKLISTKGGTEVIYLQTDFASGKKIQQDISKKFIIRDKNNKKIEICAPDL